MRRASLGFTAASDTGGMLGLSTLLSTYIGKRALPTPSPAKTKVEKPGAGAPPARNFVCPELRRSIAPRDRWCREPSRRRIPRLGGRAQRRRAEPLEESSLNPGFLPTGKRLSPHVSAPPSARAFAMPAPSTAVVMAGATIGRSQRLRPQVLRVPELATAPGFQRTRWFMHETLSLLSLLLKIPGRAVSAEFIFSAVRAPPRQSLTAFPRKTHSRIYEVCVAFTEVYGRSSCCVCSPRRQMTAARLTRLLALQGEPMPLWVRHDAFEN